MVRIAPIRLAFNPKTLWFDAVDLELSVDDAVVVQTARGSEFGHVAQAVFDMEYEETKKLKSPLKPVLRIADEEDLGKAEQAEALSMEALPVFRRVAKETVPDMNPIAVEYLFDGSKAVFYFDADERVDFRDLVRKLAAELHVRVDMKQIGVRDGARMVGGLGHCGQELCCRRLGGEFNPVSIRMAKEQDLSLNPQKISGICGRLMCCLRYEFDAYKDFHNRAPKKNARVETPDGEGKVVDLDVPREIVSIKVGDEKPVKVPLADMDAPEEGARPTSVGDEAWEKANTPVVVSVLNSSSLFTSQLSAEDKLAEPGKVRHTGSEGSSKSSRSRSRRRGGSGRSQESKRSQGRSDAAASEATQTGRKQRRRRSTTVSSDGTTKVTEQAKQPKQQKQGKKADGQHQDQQRNNQAAEGQKKSSSRRRSRNRSANKQQGDKQQAKNVQVGRNSSGLRAGRAEGDQKGQNKPAESGSGQATRRRRRSHKTNTQEKASE